jgi:glycosyltransferase involved in cell wall biosynthesis
LIYGSNYARGLEHLLNSWPEIKKAYPDATLDIYYGWQTWGLLTPEKEKRMREQIASYKDQGVTDHGKVGHEELNRAYEAASIWAYPCTAPETFCITALRAQLAGAIPVILEGTALPETVRFGYKTKNLNEYPALLIKAMKEAETATLESRQKMGDFIRKEFTWKAVAQKWDALFRNRE